MDSRVQLPERMNKRYQHTQHGRLHFILIGVTVLLLALAAPQAGVEPAIAGGLLMAAAFSTALAAMFARLTVTEEADHIRITFGPLSLLSRKVRFADIKDASVSRSSLIDGWGIHWVIRRGWIWNVWGFDCVKIEFTDGRRLRVGSDDAKRLAALLRERSGPQ